MREALAASSEAAGQGGYDDVVFPPKRRLEPHSGKDTPNMGLSTMTMPKAAAWLRRLSSGLLLYRGATNLAVMRSTPRLT